MKKFLIKWLGCATADHTHEEIVSMNKRLGELESKLIEMGKYETDQHTAVGESYVEQLK